MAEPGLQRAIRATLMPGFAGPVLPEWLAAEVASGLGAVCLFGSNVVSAGQLRELIAAVDAAGPALIAIDEEGGDVSRLHHRDGSPQASPAYLGRLDSLPRTRDSAAAIGAELAGFGIGLNLAPVADVNSNPRNPVIGVRSFGADAALVARHVAAATTGLQQAGVAACVKHFPGHGDTSVDSHLDLPRLVADRDTLLSRELLPFAAAVHAGALAVMTSHLIVEAIDPELPATLSPRVLSLLRTEIGFTGAIVSDALDMAGASRGRGIAEAAVLALAAGVDLLCLGAGTTTAELGEIRSRVADAVATGRLPASRVQEAAERVAQLKDDVAGLRRRRVTAVAAALLPTAPFEVRRTFAPVVSPLLVKLESPGNIAAAETAWGIDEHLRDALDRQLRGATCARAGDLAGLEQVLAAGRGRPLVVQGRDLARVEFLAAAVTRLRAERPDAILVELGWPDAAGTWDVATFGGGRGNCEALIRLLASGT